VCNIYSLLLNDLNTIRLVQNIFLDTESVLYFSAQCLFKTLFAPINMQQATVEVNTEMWADLHVKWS